VERVIHNRYTNDARKGGVGGRGLGFRFKDPGFWFLVSGFWFLVSGVVVGTRHALSLQPWCQPWCQPGAPCTWGAPGWHLDTWHLQPGIWHL